MKSDVESTFGLRSGPGAVLPADLVAAVAATVLADVVVLVGAPRSLSLGAAAMLLFFLPGYAIVSALYPGATPDRDGTDGGMDEARGGIVLYERIALSFGASIAALPVLGLVAWQVGTRLSGPVSTGTGITRGATLLLLTLLVVLGCGVAAVRRLRRPRADRFSVSVADWIDAGRDALTGGETRSDQLLNVTLAVSILLAAGALGYAVTSPVIAEQYTSATLLVEGDDGELVAGGYPSDLTAGESAELVLELSNHEGVPTTYTTVVQIERVDTAGDDPTVTEARELDRLSVAVPPGETRTVPHEVAAELSGERLRLSYYVYRGDAPEDPSASSAYRHLYLWVSVEGS